PPSWHTSARDHPDHTHLDNYSFSNPFPDQEHPGFSYAQAVAANVNKGPFAPRNFSYSRGQPAARGRSTGRNSSRARRTRTPSQSKDNKGKSNSSATPSSSSQSIDNKFKSDTDARLSKLEAMMSQFTLQLTNLSTTIASMQKDIVENQRQIMNQLSDLSAEDNFRYRKRSRSRSTLNLSRPDPNNNVENSPAFDIPSTSFESSWSDLE